MPGPTMNNAHAPSPTAADVGSETLAAMLAIWEADPGVDELIDSLMSASSTEDGSSENEGNDADLSSDQDQPSQQGAGHSDSTPTGSPITFFATPANTAAVAKTTRSEATGGATSKPSAARSTRRVGKKKRAPPRSKIELVQLRQAAQQLECQVRVLRNREAMHRGDLEQQAATTLVTRNPMTIPTGVGAVSTKLYRSMWEDIAVRQYRQRRRAEQENAALKGSIEDHAKLLAGLQRFVKRGASSIQHNTPMFSMDASFLDSVVDHDPAVQSATTQELLHRVAEMYASVDQEMTTDSRFAVNTGKFREVSCGSDGGELPMVAIRERRLVPFDMQATADAIWHRHAWRSTKQGHFPFSYMTADDTMIKGFQMTLATPLHTGSIQGTIVGRKYSGKDRVVIVWAADLSFPTPAVLPFRRVNAWTVVRRATGDCETGAATDTQIESKHVVNPASMAASHSAPQQLNFIADFISRAVSQYQEKIDRSVDNALLTQLAAVKITS